MTLGEILRMLPPELEAVAAKLRVKDRNSMRERELVLAILEKSFQRSEKVFAEGSLEILPTKSGFGFLRLAEFHYTQSSYDIYVGPSQIKKFKLQTGDVIEGEIRPPKGGEPILACVGSRCD